MSGRTWDAAAPGVLQLPSGRQVRGRGLRRPLPEGAAPDVGLYLLGRPPLVLGWEVLWLPWRDFGLPSDTHEAERLLREVWRRAASERVEIACGGGRGRTGTALACLAVLDGLQPGDAIALVRAGYDRGAVETPWQRRFVARFAR